MLLPCPNSQNHQRLLPALDPPPAPRRPEQCCKSLRHSQGAKKNPNFCPATGIWASRKLSLSVRGSEQSPGMILRVTEIGKNFKEQRAQAELAAQRVLCLGFGDGGHMQHPQGWLSKVWEPLGFAVLDCRALGKKNGYFQSRYGPRCSAFLLFCRDSGFEVKKQQKN